MKSGIFIFLFLATYALFPYVVTHRSYADATDVDPMFPVAILENGKPSIVQWIDYQANINGYKSKLITAPHPGRYPLNQIEFFELALKDRVYDLKLTRDDYTFWSTYSVKDGVVQPMAFRFDGVFVIFYAFIIAGLGTAAASGMLQSRRIRQMAEQDRPRD